MLSRPTWRSQGCAPSPCSNCSLFVLAPPRLAHPRCPLCYGPVAPLIVAGARGTGAFVHGRLALPGSHTRVFLCRMLPPLMLSRSGFAAVGLAVFVVSFDALRPAIPAPTAYVLLLIPCCGVSHIVLVCLALCSSEPWRLALVATFEVSPREVCAKPPRCYMHGLCGERYSPVIIEPSGGA